jgi:inward rectifier potassium channel
MLNLPRWKFIAIIIIFFFGINLLYCLVYMMIGGSQFQGLMAQTGWQCFKEMYFFSTETFTTVGYGRVNPVGDAANFVAAFEAMTGFLSFAIATGLIYGRFSKPRSYLLFTHKALISPYKGQTALMFRIASYKDNHNLSNVEIRVTLAMRAPEGDKEGYKFYELDLERIRVDTLIMNWTVVHPIDENSPLQGMNFEDIKDADVEVYVSVRGFDDVYSSIVLQRTSYVFDEIIFNAKFVPMYHESEDGRTTIFDLDKLNDYNVLG